jgi:putative flippase GtrA
MAEVPRLVGCACTMQMLHFSLQFVRFLLVGLFATALQYAILIVLVRTGMQNAIMASSIGFAVSAIANYTLNHRYTFQAAVAHTRAFPKFAIVAITGLAINGLLMWIGHSMMGLHYLLAQFCATLGTLVWNFLLSRSWTFGIKSRLNHSSTK